jgi:hypothetical protein
MGESARESRLAPGHRWGLIGRFVGAMALLGLVLAWVGPGRLHAQLDAVATGWFAAAVAMAIAANAVSAWRWAYLARALGLNAPLLPLASAYAQGITVNVLLPGATLGGDALRSVRLARLGNPPGVSALSVLLDRASGLWVLCLLSLFSVAFGSVLARSSLPDGFDPGWLMFYLACLLVAATLPWWPWRLRGGTKQTGWRGRLADGVVEWRSLIVERRAVLIRSLLPSLAVQVLSAATLWMCAKAAGGAVNYVTVLMIAAPVFVAAALPVSVGGFGPREFAATLAFTLIGASATVGAAAAVLYGLTAVVQGVLAAPLLATSPRPRQ